jgi:hypothetical protein
VGVVANKLTLKERALVKNLATSKTKKDAALKAGYSEKNPSQSANQALRSIERKMPDVMEKLGLTDESLVADYLKPLLAAEETKFFAFRKTITIPAKRKTKTAPATPKRSRLEQVIEARNVAALGIRATALDIAFKLKGSYAPRQLDFDPDHGIPVTIIDVSDIPRHG